MSLLPFCMIGVGCDNTRVIHAYHGSVKNFLETLTVAKQANSKFLAMHAELR